MGLLDYDHLELAERVQHGLDRLTANYLIAHRARVRRDLADFHGQEHLDLEVSHAGHTLRIRQVAPVRAIGAVGPPEVLEFESRFDERPSGEGEPQALAEWLRALPAGAAAAAPSAPAADAGNPFLAEATPRRAEPRSDNPFLSERAAPPSANSLAADADAEARKRRALEWLTDPDA